MPPPGRRLSCPAVGVCAWAWGHPAWPDGRCRRPVHIAPRYRPSAARLCRMGCKVYSAPPKRRRAMAGVDLFPRGRHPPGAGGEVNHFALPLIDVTALARVKVHLCNLHLLRRCSTVGTARPAVCTQPAAARRGWRGEILRTPVNPRPDTVFRHLWSDRGGVGATPPWRFQTKRRRA